MDFIDESKEESNNINVTSADLVIQVSETLSTSVIGKNLYILIFE
jgi:hypothetical protein